MAVPATSNKTPDATPDTIHGGCLCDSIRYKVTFPADHDFAKACSTCQCEQCRKNTGSLIFRVHVVPRDAVEWAATATLKTYSASPGVDRGFCTRCGSLLYWARRDGGVVNLTVGCFDKADLRRFGVVLATACSHLWCADEIVGVTDHLRGEKWRYDNTGEGAELMPGSKI